MAEVKPRLLWVGDAICHTGFARVTHSILERLQHKWDVYVVGLNYLGQPHPYRYPIWPARNGGDIWGLGEFAHLAPNINPDAICVLNDPWIVAKFASEFDRRGIPMAAYMPVDAKAQNPDVCHRLNKLDLAVFYTKFGERECRMAGFKGKSAIIPHGVDTSIFRPIPRSEARARLELSRSVTPDAFIIGNVNRNQPRKRLDLTVQYFAEWLRQRAGARDAIKNAYLFIHCAQRDSGWNLAQLAKYYGVEDRIMLPDEEAVTPAAGLPDAEMPYIYSAFDVQITTTMGEGWGLPQVESMACGIPQIMPCFSALAEWPAGAAYYVSCSAEASHIMINTIGGIPDKAECIRALDLFYRSADVRRKYAEAALVRAREPRFRWDKIAEQFDVQLNQMVSDARARTVSPEPSATGKEQEENGEAQEAERIPA